MFNCFDSRKSKPDFQSREHPSIYNAIVSTELYYLLVIPKKISAHGYLSEQPELRIYIKRHICVRAQPLSPVRLFATPWPATQQAPLSTGFPRQVYWSRLPFSSPADLPDSGMEPASPALAGRLFTTEPPGKPQHHI